MSPQMPPTSITLIHCFIGSSVNTAFEYLKNHLEGYVCTFLILVLKHYSKILQSQCPKPFRI